MIYCAWLSYSSLNATSIGECAYKESTYWIHLGIPSTITVRNHDTSNSWSVRVSSSYVHDTSTDHIEQNLWSMYVGQF